MSADKGAAVVIHDDMEPQYGVDRPVPAGDEETHGLPTDCEVTEAMGGEYTSVSVYPHPNGARAPLCGLSIASPAQAQIENRSQVPADGAGVPDRALRLA